MISLGGFRFARFSALMLVITATLTWTTSAQAVMVVNDQWHDTTRTDPTAANGYSENGTDSDGDGSIESAWYRSGTGGTMAVVASGGGAAVNGAPNVLRTNVSTGTSASWTTYFTPEGSEVNLAAVGDSMTVTWVFTPGSMNSASTSATGFRLGVVDTTGGRISSDITPLSTATYSGYGIFMNMNTTISATDPFRLHERSAPATASNLLSATGSWTALDDEETTGTTGYAAGTTYTFTMSFTHNAANGLDIAASMTGGSVGGDGSLNVTFTDTTPNGSSFKFDTFALRPSTLEDAGTPFDTSLFRVEFTPAAIPEVSSFLLLGMVGLGMIAVRRVPWSRLFTR
jgi:hypothetical protein